MNRNRIFWGAILILAWVLLLLDRTNLFRFDVWRLFWPSVIIVIGGWIIYKNFSPDKTFTEETASYPLGNIETASIDLKHGGGRLYLESGSAADNLFDGLFSGGLEYEDHHSGINVDLDLKPAVDVFSPSMWGKNTEGLKWQIRFNERVSYRFKLKTGAGEHHFNFRNLNVSEISLDTGASSTMMVLPASSDFTKVDINAGAASVEISVPDGVAAEISMKSGLSGNSVNTQRFIPSGSGLYRSENYESAEHRVQINISGGVGSFTVN